MFFRVTMPSVPKQDAPPSRGRPPLPEGNARDVTIQVKVTVAEAADIDAARASQSRSSWARNVLVQAARRRGK